MPTRSHKKMDSKGNLPIKLGIGALIAILAFALVISITETHAANTGLQGANEGMMQGLSSGQGGVVAACNQMMAGYGINQTVIASMDSMMSDMGGMMSGGMMQ